MSVCLSVYLCVVLCMYYVFMYTCMTDTFSVQQRYDQSFSDQKYFVGEKKKDSTSSLMQGSNHRNLSVYTRLESTLGQETGRMKADKCDCHMFVKDGTEQPSSICAQNHSPPDSKQSFVHIGSSTARASQHRSLSSRTDCTVMAVAILQGSFIPRMSVLT